MKKIINSLFLIATYSLISSCSNSNSPTAGGDYVPDTQIAIIKLTPDLQKYVFVSPIVDSVFYDYAKNSYTFYYGEELALYNPNNTDSILADFAISQLGILDINPYVILEEGYAIIDWRWTHFHPLSGEFRNTRNCYYNHQTNMIYAYSINSNYELFKNEEYYLLPIKWNELKDLNTIWKMNDGQHIDRPEIWHIKTTDIEHYGKMSMTSKELPLLDLFRIYTFYNTNETIYHKLDMLQASYVEILNQMINNNDLNTWKIPH